MSARIKRLHQSKVFKVIAAIVVLLFVLNLVTKSKDYSETENRSLAKRPGIMAGGLADGSYFKDFDTYYSDQFVLRDQFVKLKFIGNSLLHIKESSGVYIGKKKYQFEIPVTPDQKALDRTVKKINEFYDVHQEMKTTMMVVPSSAVILKDYLPSNAAVTDQAKDIEEFYDRIDSGISTVDVTSILEDAGKDNLYYKTDHHWTSQGAYKVFQKSAAYLGIDAPVGYKKYLVSTSFKGTLSSKSGDFVGKDKVEIYVPKSDKVSYYVTYPASQEKRASIFKPEQLKTKDKYTVFFGGNHPLVEINTTADNRRNLLIVKDSYANSFVQFLLPYYEKIIIVDPRYYYDNVNMVLSNYDINEILYLYSADTLFTDTSLADSLDAATQAQKELENAESYAEKVKREQEEADSGGEEEETTEESGGEETDDSGGDSGGENN